MSNAHPDEDKRPAAYRVPWRPWYDPAITAILACIVFVVGFGWNLRLLARPLGSGDMLQPYVTAQLWGDGSPFGNNRFGYPFGMDLRYFPTVDIAQNTVAGIVTAISKNPFLGINTVHALSFPVAALAALWVFRLTGVQGPLAIVSALAFTSIPFHWLRLEHIYLGTIYSAVVGVGLAILTGTGELSRRMNDRRRTHTIILVLVLALIVATGGIYYACFSIMLCAAALMYRFAHGGSRGALLASAVPALSIILWTAVALAPAFFYVRANPPIQPVADRVPLESVAYSGNLALLLTPAPFTELPGLSSFNQRIEHAFAAAANSGQSGVSWLSNFGTDFTLAALIVAIVGLMMSVRRRHNETLAPVSNEPGATGVTFGLVGTLLGAGVLFFVPWGLNVVFAALVTPQIRAWDRLTPILLVLFFVGAMVSVRTLRVRQGSTSALVVSVALLVLLIPDSVAPYARMYRADVANNSSSYDSGVSYASAVNAAIPGDCAMLQLPYIPYPEVPPVNSLGTYDQFWVGLTNPQKRWTYGATKGTLESLWLDVLGTNLDPATVAALGAAGFCGVHLDRRGYTPESGRLVSARLDALFGAPVATGHDGDWSAWRIPGHGSAAMSPAEVRQLPTNAAELFYPTEFAPAAGNPLTQENDATNSWWWTKSQLTDFDVHSSAKEFPFHAVEGTVRAAPCAARDVTLSLTSGGTSVTVDLHLEANGSAPFDLNLPDGVNSAELTVRASGAACQTASDSRTLFVAVENVRGK